MPNHVIFNQASGGATAASDYVFAGNAFYGYPRGLEFWNQSFADVQPNNIARADPSAAGALWAVNVSNPLSPASEDPVDYENEALFVFLTDSIPTPAGAIVQDIDPGDETWAPPFGF